jgi:hypothetical protein
MGSILTTIGALVLGGVVGTATIIGVVNSQTAAPDKSPANVNSPVIEYGSN